MSRFCKIKSILFVTDRFYLAPLGRPSVIKDVLNNSAKMTNSLFATTRRLVSTASKCAFSLEFAVAPLFRYVLHCSVIPISLCVGSLVRTPGHTLLFASSPANFVIKRKLSSTWNQVEATALNNWIKLMLMLFNMFKAD